MWRYLIFTLLIIAAAVIGFSFYFHFHRGSIAGQAGPADDSVNALRLKYLNGTRQEARQALLDEISLFSSSWYQQGADTQAAVIRLCYCRLFALDKFSGDDPLAEADFMEAREWHHRWCELVHMPATELEARMQAFTREQCLKTANYMDENNMPRFMTAATESKP